MDVNSAGSSVNWRNYAPASSTSSTQGVDRDGDNDGSGSAQASNGQGGASVSVAVNVQISNAGQVQHARHHGGHHHGNFNAAQFASKLDTSGLSSDQQQTLKDILSKYDGKKMDKNTMNQLKTDLQNAGIDVQKLFDKFQPPPNNNQQTNNQNPGNSQSAIGVSVLV